jgi:hypothetical protein
MPLSEDIRRLEEEIAQAEQVAELNQRLLGDAVKTETPPVNFSALRGTLRSARDLLKHNQAEAAQPLLRQAGEGLGAVRQWLAVSDLAVSPFQLRTYLEKNRLGGDLLRALIRYQLTKHPHAENDRDKLDFLLTAYFSPPGEEATIEPAAQTRSLEELFVDLPPPAPLSDPAVVMLHEFESLIAMIGDFNDFDQLVQSRMVERVRALKTNLAAEFYQPRVLATVVRFNLAFRRHFEVLFHQQLRRVREETRREFEEAWGLLGEVEEAFESLTQATPESPAAAPRAADAAASPGPARLGRPQEAVDERPPLDRLLRRGQERQKESELRGIVSRLSRYISQLPPDLAETGKVSFRLRQGELALEDWEREAFDAAAQAAAPESTSAIQSCLGVVAWIEEELARYQETRDDRYLWKAHLDLLSYAVTRAVELLAEIRPLFHPAAPLGEDAWREPLLAETRRLGAALRRVYPVFEEPARG